MDHYGEGLDKDSRIAHLKKRLMNCEKDLVSARESDMNRMVESTKLFENVRTDLQRKLKDSEKEREKLEESLNREKEERKMESEEAQKREAQLMKENENLQDRLKKQTEQSKKVEKELINAKTEAAELKVKQTQLINDLEDMRETNGFLATTSAGKIYDELIKAQKRIDHLEKEVKVVTPITSSVQANEEKGSEGQSLHTDDSNEMAEFEVMADSQDNLSTIPNFTHNSFLMESKKEPVEPKEEPVDTSQAIGDNNQISTLDSFGDDMDFKEEDMMNDNVAIENGFDNAIEDGIVETEVEKEESIVHITDTPKDSIDDELIEKEEEKEKKSSGNDFNSDALDEDSEPPVKKFKESDPQIETEKKDKKRSSVKNGASTIQDRKYVKTNDTELECPECDYFTLNAGSWIAHLRDAHSTNPSLAGVSLLCDCGTESVSNWHSLVCPIANFTVIRKRSGPIRRFNDQKTTPKCVLCEIYPKTPLGYVAHLQNHHKSTLAQNGIAWLTCGCGLKIQKFHSRAKHPKECNHRQFSIHKLDDK